jgi:hypothetical protein
VSDERPGRGQTPDTPGPSDPLAFDDALLDKGAVGGAALIVIVAVGFSVGWQAGGIFFYPPFLALLGVGRW